MITIPTPFDEEIETLVHQVIGCGIRVHRELGPGLLEQVYCRALAVEFALEAIPFECEREFSVSYRGHPIATGRIDVVVAGKLLLEVKAVDRLAAVHRAQVIGYLRPSGLKLGLLMNFNTAVLADGIKRIVLSAQL
jgi:GxxExxY protein